MALRYIDSFDHYTTAALPSKWNYTTAGSGSAPATIAAGAGRNGTQCLRFTNTLGNCLRVFDTQAGWCVGLAVKLATLAAGPAAVVRFNRAGALTCNLSIDATGHLILYKAINTAVTGGTSTNTLSTGTWYYIEVAVKPTTSVAANSCYVNVDGVTWATVAAGQNLQGATASGADSITIYGAGGIGNFDVDDLYICDDQAGATGPFGNTMVQCLYPSADGTTNDWTASTGSRYACVNEATVNDDTNYVYYATTGGATTLDAVQLFGMQDMTYTPAAITGIQWNCYGRKGDAGYRFVKRVIRSNATTSTNPVVNYTNTFGLDYQTFSEVLETDPCNSNAAWTRTSIDALEAGFDLYAFG